MRIDGTLAKWNDDRGFGFIAPTGGGQEIFVHISAFPKDCRRPRLGETLSFEIETDINGKKRAKAILCPGSANTTRARRRESTLPRAKRSLFGRAAPLILLVVLGAYGYREYSQRFSTLPGANNAETRENASPSIDQGASSARFQCDGRTRCSQMTSCAEATFFLRNCPNVQMDGNHDGVPCEQQWCTSPFAK